MFWLNTDMKGRHGKLPTSQPNLLHMQTIHWTHQVPFIKASEIQLALQLKLNLLPNFEYISGGQLLIFEVFTIIYF